MKMKTRKIVAKRFKVTKTGLFLRGRQNARHLRNNKSKGLIRKYKTLAKVHKSMVKKMITFLPYT